MYNRSKLLQCLNIQAMHQILNFACLVIDFDRVK